VQEHHEELHQLAQSEVLLPPEALLDILALRRGVIVAIHHHVHQDVEHADKEDMTTITVESNQQVRRDDHKDMVEYVEEGNLPRFLAQHKEDGFQQVEQLVQMVQVG